MTKKQNSKEGDGKKSGSFWTYTIIVVIVIILIYNYTQDKKDDAIDCLDDCESENLICSHWGYLDLTSKEELQDCLDKFNSCVDDCKTILEE